MVYFTASVFALMGTIVYSEAFGQGVGDSNRYLSQVGFDQVGRSLFGAKRSNATLRTQFGAAVSLSSDGRRLAIGATGHDVDPATTTGNGAVFLYNFNGTDWDPSTFILGDADEGIGNNFALSDDGSRIAVRRYGDTVNPVDVYNAATGVQIGASLQDCNTKGNAVSISSTGNRVAVSCEQWKPVSTGRIKVGRMHIYDWNGSAYVLQGTLDGDSTLGDKFFSWAASFGKDGDRLAITSVFHDDIGGIKQVGQVRVFDYNGTQWTQLGNEVIGGTFNGRFGMSVDLDVNGTTFVVGAPTTDSNDTNVNGGAANAATANGEVHVFELVTNQWVLKGQVVQGEIAGDELGRAVAISDDGTRFAASTHDARGQVRLFDWDISSSSWKQAHGAIEGLEVGDEFGSGITSVGLSGDGYRVASASVAAPADDTSGVSTGRARVFDQDTTPSSTPSHSIDPSSAPSIYVAPPSTTPSAVPSFEPSNAPSSSPSDQPSISPSASLSKTPSSVPSDASSDLPTVTATTTTTATATPSSAEASAIPTVKLGKFEWDLTDPFNVTAEFSGNTENEEIKLSYNISRRTAIITIYEENCLAPAGDLVAITQDTDITSSTHAQLDVTLDVIQDTVVGSNIWRNGSTTGEAFIELCVRVDLVLDDANQTSVNFHEQKLYLKIGLSQGFVVSEIHLSREAAGEDSQDAQVDFGLTACQCNSTAYCVNEIYFQGDDVYICVFADENSDIEIAAVEELDFVQGNLTVLAIDNSAEDVLTEVLAVGKIAIVRSQMRSEFFVDAQPASVVTSGSVSLTFGSAQRTLRIDSLLRGTDQATRMTQEKQSESSGFNTVQLALATDTSTPPTSNVDSSSGANAHTVVAGALGGLACIALIVVAVVLRKKKDEEDEDEPANGETFGEDLALDLQA